ncbi:MAG: biotin/lipoyl-binding protein, partial [Coriobacteriia bacterium]|nr:biotin/lipoyl-binding protein [Coriobacteriia bacterium]
MMKTTMKLRGGRTTLIAIAALVLVAGSAFYGYAATAEDSNTVPPTALVTTGSIQSSVPAEGRIAVQRWELAFASQGVVTQVYVKPGDKVSAGQVLAALDGDKSDSALNQALAALAGAEAKLDGVRAQPSSADVAVKHALVDAAVASLDSAQRAYDLLVAESHETTVSNSEIQAKAAAITNAMSALRIAQANLDAARIGATSDEIASARAAVAQAEASVDAAT